LPPDARLVFSGLPIAANPHGVAAFGWEIEKAMQLAFDSRKLQAYNLGKFPLWEDRLDQTYFFVYTRRQVTERTDLERALQERNRCANVSTPAITWEFSRDAQGWEAWNDLSQFEYRDGMLAMRATGNDPYLASPEIGIDTMAIGQIEITMRVRSEQAGLHGSIYWRATDQSDFSPDLQAPFPLQSDGEFHSYRVDIAKTEKLLMGDQITRLRLDPSDAPADIAIKSIVVYTHCTGF
jgi:hypothetical protein